MTKLEILNQIDRLKRLFEDAPKVGLVQAKEFIKIYIGTETHFYKSINNVNENAMSQNVRSDSLFILNGLKDYAENGLLRNISLEREIQIETVSDYLEQAQTLLNDAKVHPGAAAVIIGASLEEFLRTWLIELQFDFSTIKNSLDAYANQLKVLGKIDKQDSKDIVSWGGIRNDAAHGYWKNVEDRNRIKIMLESVNLFMRKYSN